MTNHHDYQKIYLGESDIASLILVGITQARENKQAELVAEILGFSMDGDYMAYVVDEEAIIPDYSEKEFEFTSWMNVYDDDKRMARFFADSIRVYRAGDMGCIIQTIGKKKIE